MFDFDGNIAPGASVGGNAAGPAGTGPGGPGAPGNTIGVTRGGQFEKQSAVVYDLLCAGEIEGIVGGLSGVYLNGTAIADNSPTTRKLLAKQGKATTTANSTTITNVTDNQGNGLFTNLSTSDINTNSRWLQIKGAGKTATLSTAAAENAHLLVTSTDDFFASYMMHKPGLPGQPSRITDSVAYLLRVIGLGEGGGDHLAVITYVADQNSGTNNSAYIYPPLPKAAPQGTTIEVDYVGRITSISNASTCVVSPAVNRAVTGGMAMLGAATVNSNNTTGVAQRNYENARATVYRGSRYQAAHTVPGSQGAAAASYMIAPNFQLKWHNSNDPTSGQSTYFINSSAFSFTQNTKEEVDKVVIAIEMPGGLSATTDEGGKRDAFIEFQIVLEYKINPNAGYETVLLAGKNYGGTTFDQNVPAWSNVYKTQRDTFYSIGGSRYSSSGVIKKKAQKVKFIQEFEIDLKPYQPLSDWRIGIKRMSPDSTKDYTIDKHTFVGMASVKTAEAIVEEKLRFPMSAYSVVEFSAEDFSTPPQRAYHIRGKKIKVPSNYITREENGDLSAKYTRNKTTGADTGSYVTWDGTFRGDLESNTPAANAQKVYCNNPAWIFYDMLTDKDIGLGEFIQESDIDKYALYQIARHCDELVPDGKGGLEPRFRCNVYFQKQEEAYKVLKDLASAFRGMMFWIDGQITPVQDTLKESVYTFTNGNVEDGIFSYTYTGQRARINQVNVNWSNPDEEFKQTIVTVDDTANILQQNRVISKDVVAFGSTSESQARRVGMWHLLTDTKETEIVSFTTGINASFLRPGDFINVQDHYSDNIIASGRVNSSSNTTHTFGTSINSHQITLDREVTLSNYSAAPSVGGSAEEFSHILYLIYPDPGTYLAQDTSVTIDNVVYNRGDLITANSSGNPITTKEAAANLVDDSGNVVQVQFSPNTRIEKRNIMSKVDSGGRTNIKVRQPFTALPNSEVIWAIGPTEEFSTVDIKTFRIASVSEEGSSEKYSISGTQVYTDKYGGVDSFRKVVVPDYSTGSNADEAIPYPENISVELTPSASATLAATGQTALEAVISWSNPQEDFVDSAGQTVQRDYRFTSRFEIQHNLIDGNLPGGFAQTGTSGGVTNVKIGGVEAGTYTVKIRTVSDSGAKSPWNVVNRTLTAPPPNLSRVGRVARGGILTSSIDFNYSSGKLTFEEDVYAYISTANEVNFVGISSTITTAQKEVNFSSMPNNTEAFLYFDESTSPANLWKVVTVHTDTVATDTAGLNTNNNYFKEVGATNNGLVATPGLISVATGITLVVGDSNTTFLTDFAPGDLIKITDGSNVGTEVTASEYNEIAEVVNDYTMYLTTSMTRTFTNKYAMKQALKPDFSLDSILARIQKGSTGSYSAEFFTSSKGQRGAGRWQIPVTTIPTTSSQAQTAWDTNWTERPGAAVVGDQAIFFEGTPANHTAQGAWTYDGGAWQQQAEVIDGDLVVTGSITTDKIFANAITADKIAANQITANEITTNSIEAKHVGADVINANHIAAGEIKTEALAADAITADKIAAGAVTADSVAANSIVATLIDATTVNATDITTANLSALSANLGNITAGTMKNSGANSIPDANSAPSGNEKGAHIDLDAGKFVFGSASKHVLWDGTNLTLSGVNIDASSTVQAPSGIPTIKEDGNSEGTNITSLNFTTGLNVAVSSGEATIHVDASTSNISEGTRLYFTNARADARVNAVLPDTDSLSEGSSNLYYTTGRFNTDFSNRTTNHLTEGANNLYYTNGRFDTRFGLKTTTDLTEGTNLYHTTSRVRAALSADDNGGLGSFSYNSSTGAYTYTGPATSEIRGLVSHTDAGGMGSFSYASSTGVFTYTGPAEADIRALFSGGAGIAKSSSGEFSISSGDGISIGTDSVAVDSTVVRTSGAQTIGGNKTFSNNVTVSGDFTVSGTTTTINTASLVVEDNKILVNSAQTGTPATSVTAGIEVERGDSTNKSFVYAESGVGESGNTAAGWTFGSERVQAGTFFGTFVGDVTGTPSSLVGLTTDNLAEGTNNLYFTDARAQAAIAAGNGLGKSGGTLSVNAGTGIALDNDNVTVSGLTTSHFAAATLQTGSEGFSDSDSIIMTAAAVQDKILSYGYTTNTGDITGVTVTAGAGLTGGGTDNAGAVSLTLNVGAGSGISVASDAVAVDSTVLRTTTSFGGDISGTYGSIQVHDADTVDSLHASSFLRSDANDTFTGQLTMNTQKALIANDYGMGVYGKYSPTRYQHIWGMGTAYNLPSNGLDESGAAGNFYGLAFAYNPNYSYSGSNVQSKSGLGHQMLLMFAGVTKTAIGDGIWTNGTITTNSHGTSANWNTAYGWGDHSTAGYITNSASGQTSNIYIRNTSPTLYLRDTDHISSMIHQNSNVFYILRADSADDSTWTTFGTGAANNAAGRWPLTMNITDSGNYVQFGSASLSAGGYTVWHAGNTAQYTVALNTKLAGIETGATADQTAAEIRSLVDSASDSNVFTNALKVKLDNIAENATNTAAPFYTSAIAAATTSAAGLMSAADKTRLDNMADNANNYSLPTATASVLGGVKVGTNLSISNGVLSADNQSFTLPTATASTLGGVKVAAASLISVDGNGFIDIEKTGTLITDVLSANTIIATMIEADVINANHLAISNNASSSTSAGIYMDGDSTPTITIRDSNGNLRVELGYLA